MSEQHSHVSTHSTDHLWIQRERKFSLLPASSRKRKTNALFASTASIPRTTPDQSLVSMAAGELGSAIQATITDLASTRHGSLYTNPWK